ncbi:DUF11 domain-containing protein [Ramlibacter sp. USB13]|uniref:DUF11 domain-containing protein n=1 Tax=Ramlibacter cellulosilyticus TaxID=2764187 RepID=A0A923SCY2_9BURK|nr:DUF11 domain-containing protein [Ramlibacter cellulosilyticus]MBC5781362.1 DUF11 domain-containing protein [Ramlibacter cellulosilyticus]
MTATLALPRPAMPWLHFARGLAVFFLMLVLALAGTRAFAAPPPAGTSISNMASATYSDGSGVARTVTSNEVKTTVTQVYSLTLDVPGSQSANPGSVVYYPHTLTNTGNGSDSFNLTVASSAGFTMGSMQIFADNGSGQPTGLAITTPVTVAANGTFKFIVQGTVPAGATNGQTNTMTVTARSVGDNTKVQTNADVTTVTSNAVVTLNKSISVGSGPAGTATRYTYTIGYTNTGNSTASTLAIADTMPVGMTYVPGSARWSITGAATPVDTGSAVGTAPNTLTASYDGPTRKLTATVNTVAAGQSGWVSFQVTVDANVPPSTLLNTATATYNNGATTANATSNQVPFTVVQTAAVTMAGDTVANANAGTTVTFRNVVTNNGNGSDTFNIVLAATNTFPTGTTFQLYKADELTPLVDTNGDGVPDTGPVAANGGTYTVVVKATLPPNASGTGPFAIQKTATSTFDATKSSTATDTLTAVTKAAVDLAHTASGTGNGAGAGPEAAGPVVTLSGNPGTTVTFTLVTRNTGPISDSYNLGASTDSAFATQTLPAGWSVTFKADASGGACTTTGATITNTGPVAASGSATVCAVVSIPAGFDAGTTQVYFRALSPTSSAVDVLRDAVTVNAVRSLSLAPNGTGQTYPGGSYVYTHTLTNNGNVAEGGTGGSTISTATTNNGPGWTSTLYYDTNGNGILDATDALVGATLNVGAGGLAKGASMTIFNKVIAPSGAVAGTVNATTITVTTVNAGYSTTAPADATATDSTTVISGNLTLVKEQAIDATCDGTPDTAYSQAALNAGPGQCVMYRITVTNVGAANATSIVVSDATPTFTTISTLATTSSGAITGPAVGASGTINAYIGSGASAGTGGTLSSSQSATITFGVKIAQ